MQAKKHAGSPSYSLTWEACTVVYKVFGVQLLGELELFTLQKLDEE